MKYGITRTIGHQLRPGDIDYLLCGPDHWGPATPPPTEFLVVRFVNIVEGLMTAKDEAEHGRKLQAREAEAAGKRGGGRR